MIVSTDASIVAAITLTTSSRMPSRIHEAKTNPVLRTNSAASRPRSGSMPDRNERAACSNASDDSLPIRFLLHDPQEDYTFFYSLKYIVPRLRNAGDPSDSVRHCDVCT